MSKWKHIASLLLSDYTRRQKRDSVLWGGLVAIIVLVLYSFCGQSQEGLRYIENIIQRTWVTQTFRHRLYDSGEATGMSRMMMEKVVLVVFDESSLREGLAWPLQRDVYLRLVNKLEKAGADTIVLDIIFSGPSHNPLADEQLKKAYAHPSLVTAYGLEANEDKIYPSMVYDKLVSDWTDKDFLTRMGFTQDMPDTIDKRVRLAILKLESSTEKRGVDNLPHYALGVVALAHYLKKTPEEIIELNAHNLTKIGFVLPGSNQIFTATVGRIAFYGSDLSTVSNSLDNEDLSGEYQRSGQVTALASDGNVADIAVPAISDFIQVYPVHELLNTPDEQLPGLFGYSIDPKTGAKLPNRVLALIGVNVPGGHDIKLSEVGPISGPGIHANILWDLMQGTFIKELDIRSSIVIIVLLSGLAICLATVLEIRLAAFGLLVLVVGYWFVGYEALSSSYWTTGGTLLPALFPWLGATACFGTVAIHNVRAQKQVKDKMIRLIQETTPIPDPAQLIEKRGLEVGADEKVLTVLFSDIRGYTDLSENLPPVEITKMLNTYHSAMGNVIERYGGIVFDYQGDAQMVVFGLLPESQPNHAAAACKAGAGMVLCLQNLREKWLAEGKPVFEAGIGISTGPTAIGLLGSAQRKQYAAIGDTTNTSARMQGKSKELNCPVLLTESTYQAAGNDIIARYLDSVRVKGKREPIKVYGVDIEQMKEQKGVIG